MLSLTISSQQRLGWSPRCSPGWGKHRHFPDCTGENFREIVGGPRWLFQTAGTPITSPLQTPPPDPAEGKTPLKLIPSVETSSLKALVTIMPSEFATCSQNQYIRVAFSAEKCTSRRHPTDARSTPSSPLHTSTLQLPSARPGHGAEPTSAVWTPSSSVPQEQPSSSVLEPWKTHGQRNDGEETQCRRGTCPQLHPAQP